LGKFDRFWEMKEGGPYDSGEEVFKCTGCGAVTAPRDGFDGEPDPHLCTDKCRGSHAESNSARISRRYKDNFKRIFPDSPGADL